jgi:putative membrane protein
MASWLAGWPLAPGVAVPLAAAAACYLRGRSQSRRSGLPPPPREHALAFLGGLGVVALALAAPVDALAETLLLVHMAQHTLLMMLAPPLIWLGAPLAPLLHGLPRPIVRAAAPVLARPAVRLGRGLAHPAVAWTVFAVAVWAWHAPALYELARHSPVWHHVQHACFLGAGLLFWWPVIRPWPSRPRGPRWILIPYLVLADVQNTVLAAIFTFADRVIYPSYAAAPRPWALSALQDQATAGAVMWVPGSVAFLLPVGWLVWQLLAPRRPLGRGAIAPSPGS